MDSYPIILTSRVESLADLWGNFSERLMDGLYPSGAFYRPLLNLSFAFDHALWGLAAFGYQLSNVLWFAFCALSLYIFLVARPVPRAPAYGLVGVVLFLFHPLQFEVLPFPPRRSELMCTAFMLLALAAEAGRGRRFRALGAAATLLALAAKETAVILPGLVFLRALVVAGGDGGRGRAVAAARRALLSAAPVAIFLAARFAVLGGIGGRGLISPAGALEIFPQTLGTLLLTVASPSSLESWTRFDCWLLLSLPLLLLPWLSRGLRTGLGTRQLADLLFAAGWLILLAILYTLSRRLSPWYAVVAVVGFSIALSAICEGYGGWLRRGSAALRVAGVAGLVAVSVLVVESQLRFSPIIRSYRLWQSATVEDARLLERFEETLEQTEDGSVARLLAERKKIKGVGEASMFHGVVLQTHYSLQAWANLFHPDRQVRVLKNPRLLKTEPLGPSEVVVILDRVPRSKRTGRRPKRPPGDGGPPHQAAGGDTR